VGNKTEDIYFLLTHSLANRPSVLGENLGKSFNNPDYFTDLKLNIITTQHNTTNSQQATLQVHRCILAARSPVLREILLNNTEKAITIINDFPVDLNVAMIKYLFWERGERNRGEEKSRVKRRAKERGEGRWREQ
jgi:hypothetical protein